MRKKDVWQQMVYENMTLKLLVSRIKKRIEIMEAGICEDAQEEDINEFVCGSPEGPIEDSSPKTLLNSVYDDCIVILNQIDKALSGCF